MSYGAGVHPGRLPDASASSATTAPGLRGHLGIADFGRPREFKPGRLHPFSADNNAWFYGLRWRQWGQARASGRGKAAANNCTPNCAEGRFIRRRGARATLFRIRPGTCDGEPARFYTRARLHFPFPLGIRAFTVKLRRGCLS
jgi:hypothetical protein